MGDALDELDFIRFLTDGLCASIVMVHVLCRGAGIMRWAQRFSPERCTRARNGGWHG